MKDIVEILISKGANVNDKDIPLSNIKLRFQIKIMQNIERILNEKNNTPLHYAAIKNAKEIGELLISKGADIHATNFIYQIRIYSF